MFSLNCSYSLGIVFFRYYLFLMFQWVLFEKCLLTNLSFYNFFNNYYNNCKKKNLESYMNLFFFTNINVLKDSKYLLVKGN